MNIAAWMVGKFAVSTAVQSYHVVVTEVLPTVVRTGLMGIIITVAHVVSVLAPVVPMLATIAPFLPSATYVVLSAIGALVVWVLPEVGNYRLAGPSFDCAILASGV